ncbi:MAG: hypothetical protein JRJ84_10980 [Deltaproteobacteria bacterium]|nr:hypothetical protein [Deltaproteobacteria bacterium]
MTDDEPQTEFFKHRRFISPLDRVEDLPQDGPKNGLLCLVREEAAIYELVDGEWRKWVSTDATLE